MNYRYFVVELNKRLYQVDIYTNGYSVEKKTAKIDLDFCYKKQLYYEQAKTNN